MGIVFSNTSATDMDASYQYGGKNNQNLRKYKSFIKLILPYSKKQKQNYLYQNCLQLNIWVYTYFLYFQSALTIAHAKPYEPEFVKSFLNRPNLLSNSTSLSHNERNSISLRSGKVTLSLYMDNWTPYILKVNK